MVVGRVCNRCLEFKVWEQFAINSKGMNNRKSICKVCSNKAQVVLNKTRRENESEELSRKRRSKHLKMKYGITLSDYDKMLVQQSYGCAICKRTDNGLPNQNQLYIDHCHNNGHVRGLLCYYCNTVLGLAFDKVEILESAINYLKNDGKQYKNES